jgi:lysophospholipase L1-like esterase
LAPIQKAEALPLNNAFLANAKAKLQKEKKLNIAYLGGSITYGTGVPAAQLNTHSWRALTTAWFKSAYPNAAITELNAAISGTTSEYGAYRVKEEVLFFKPDLLFVEFCVNDTSGTVTDSWTSAVKRSMEGIVRAVWADNPNADIVFFYTMRPEFMSAYENEELPPSVSWHHEIAEHYKIPEINGGKAMYEYARDELGDAGRVYTLDGSTPLPKITVSDWYSVGTTDTLHPNEAGHAFFADAVTARVSDWLNAAGNSFNRAVPPPKDENFIDAVHTGLAEYFSASLPATWVIDKSNVAYKPYALHVLKPKDLNVGDAELDFPFTGTDVGIMGKTATGPCWLYYSIDGGAEARTSMSNVFVSLVRDLAPGQHTLHLRASKNGTAGLNITLGSIVTSGQ